MDACREFICSGFGNACGSIGRCFCGTEQEVQQENYEPDKHEPAVDKEPMGSESNDVLDDAENNSTKPNIQTDTIYSAVAGSTVILKCTIDVKVHMVVWSKRATHDETFADIKIDNTKYLSGSVVSPSLVIALVDEEDAGTYICRATNKAGDGVSREIKVTVRDAVTNNFSVLPTMNQMQGMIPKHVKANINVNVTTYVENADIVSIGDAGRIQSQNKDDSDKTESETVRDDVKRNVGACGKISEFDTRCPPDLRECRVQLIIGKCVPNLELKTSIGKQLSEALGVDERIINVEFIIRCIIVSFEITGASSPSELTAITLAARFRSGINDGSICLTDEKGNALSIRKDSIELKTSTDGTYTDESCVPIVSIAQSGYVVIAGEIAVLTCTTLSTEPVTCVKWYRINKEDGQESAIEVDNNKYFGGSTESPSLVINNTDRHDEGLYMCRAVNGNGEGESPPAFLRIYIDNEVPKIEGKPTSGPSNDDTPEVDEGGQVFPSSGSTNMIHQMDEKEMKSKQGNALSNAVEHGHIEIVKLLLSHGADPNVCDALELAACRGYTDIVKLLLSNGSDPYKDNALSGAAVNGHIEIVKLLLCHGADPNVDNALSDVVENGHIEIVKLLLSRGADPNVGKALLRAVAYGHIEIVKLLLSHGADPNVYHALKLAACIGHTRIVKLMLNNGSDLDKGSALSGAAVNGHIEIVKMLLSHGADPNVCDALELAALGGYTDIVKLLLSNGSDLYKGNALSRAAAYGNI